MDNYQKAYERYLTACQCHGMIPMSIQQFIEHLTKEQLNAYSKLAS